MRESPFGNHPWRLPIFSLSPSDGERVGEGDSLNAYSRLNLQGIRYLVQVSTAYLAEASWTIFPSTTVTKAWISLIRSASHVSRSSESTTRSASLPVSIDPFRFSSKLK